MADNIRDLLDPQDLAEAKQEGLRKKIEDQRIDINELPQLPEGAIDAIRIAGMELKIKVTELLKELETLNNKDPRYVDVKKEIANKVQVMQAWKSSFGSFQQAKQEFFQNLFSYSKANNQLHIARLSDYFGDNHMGWQINGTDVGLLTEEEVFVSTNEIVSLANRLMLPANKERNQLMEQAFVVSPNVKGNEFIEIMRALFDKEKVEIIEPAEGTSPTDVLQKHLHKYIYGPRATTYKSFESGKPFIDNQYAWFVYDEFYADLKTKEWKIDPQRTSYMIREIFKSENKDKKALFNKPKRFPGKNSNGDYFPPIKALRIPLYLFEEKKDVKEIVEFEDEEDIL